MLLLSGNFSADAIPQITHYALRTTTFGSPKVHPPIYGSHGSSPSHLWEI